jgi:hypothetical protein
VDYERENQKLRACLREIYRSFHYGPGASSTQAPFIRKMIEDALGWEAQTLPVGVAGGSASFGSASGFVHCGYGGGGRAGTMDMEPIEYTVIIHENGMYEMTRNSEGDAEKGKG